MNKIMVDEKILYLALVTALNTEKPKHYEAVSGGLTSNRKKLSNEVILKILHRILEKMVYRKNMPQADRDYWMEIYRELNQEIADRYKEERNGRKIDE